MGQVGCWANEAVNAGHPGLVRFIHVRWEGAQESCPHLIPSISMNAVCSHGISPLLGQHDT